MAHHTCAHIWTQLGPFNLQKNPTKCPRPAGHTWPPLGHITPYCLKTTGTGCTQSDSTSPVRKLILKNANLIERKYTCLMLLIIYFFKIWSQVLTCRSLNLVRFTLDFFDDCVHLDNVSDPRGQSCDEVGVLCVGNPDLGYSGWKLKECVKVCVYCIWNIYW